MHFSSEEEINDNDETSDNSLSSIDKPNKSHVAQTKIQMEKIALSESDRDRIRLQRGIISLHFSNEQRGGEEEIYPLSYTTTTPKERLLLFYAENFRRQLNKLRPLVLAVPNQV